MNEMNSITHKFVWQRASALQEVVLMPPNYFSVPLMESLCVK
jgi:hypothetical protein